MRYMFNLNSAFNAGNIGGWNTASVKDVSSMFHGASVFDQNIGAWNFVSLSGGVMDGMFSGAAVFNQNIGAWNVARVVSFVRFFY